MTAPPFPLPYGPIAAAAKEAVLALRQAGHEAYFAGGFTRDLLIGRPVHDIDIATSARPPDVATLFTGSREVGKSFGVMLIHLGGFHFEVATFRRDGIYRDGRRPEDVVFTTAAEDASRRDFTANGMFYDPVDGVIIDYVNGQADVAANIIRAIGDPEVRFTEDRLRIMRAIRFASVLNFTIEQQTWEAIRAFAPKLAEISIERIRDEFIRTLMEAPRPGKALYMLRDAGVLNTIFPELQAMNGVEQPPEFHPEGDVFVHTALMLDLMQERSPALIWSILLHDVGKPATFSIGTDKQGRPRIQFMGHAEVGAEMTPPIMRRFRCSNEEIEQVVVAVRHHMRFASTNEMRNATLRKWVGAPTFPLELELHRIDCLASHGGLDHFARILDFQKELRDQPALPPRLIGGRDLIGLGLKGGPAIGQLLKQIYDAQLEGAITTHEEGMRLAKQLMAQA